MEDRYITTDQSGWLRVKLEPNGKIIALPRFLKVNFRERQAGRDYFDILEGVHQGLKASVSSKGGASSWLVSPMPIYKGPVKLLFKKGAGQLITPYGRLKTTTSSRSPISNGEHPIQLPDFPHDLGRSYVNAASKAMTWFYLGTGHAIRNNNDRYLHPGRISAGCVTVQDLSGWDRLYDLLILSRAPGGKNVGTLTVAN
ncbi:MAG: hypothetical protein ACR2QJ_01050 [Geminicoccaceae bacterium]